MNGTQHRLVSTYLGDLTRALADLDPADRAEVLAGVREHITEGLAARGGATDADVRTVLSEVGTPEAVAREAYSTGQYAERPALRAAPPAARPRWSDRPWVPVVVAVVQVVSLFLLLAVAGGAATYTTFEVIGSEGESLRSVDYDLGTTVMWAVASVLGLLPLWIGIALLVGNSRLWTTRHKFMHLLLLPVSALVVGLSPDLGWILAGERGLNIASVTGLVLVVVVAGWLLVRLTRAGRVAADH